MSAPSVRQTANDIFTATPEANLAYFAVKK
jgi:hypothetical protein